MKLTSKEVRIRYDRLDTLRVLTEGFEEGEGFNIYQKAYRAENRPDEEFNGIIRLTKLEKEFLESILYECGSLTDEEKVVLKWYIG